MQQREVTDQENTRWTCVQAYSGLKEDKAEKATELADTSEGKVDVVCTPTGGAQSVRLELPDNWMEMPDEELVVQITNEQK